MGGSKSNTTQSSTTNINETNTQNVENHQTTVENHVNNQDYLKEVGGNRIGGSVNTFNGLQNGGYQCFGAGCEVPSLQYLSFQSRMVPVLQILTADPLSEGIHHLTDGSIINIIG